MTSIVTLVAEAGRSVRTGLRNLIKPQMTGNWPRAKTAVGNPVFATTVMEVDMIRVNVSEGGDRATLHAPDTFETAGVLDSLEGRKVNLLAGGRLNRLVRP